jgi:amino acid adenylation domain-containing protein
MLEKVDAGFQLSPQQMRLWSLDGGSVVTPFRASLVVLIDGPLIEERLREAIVRAIRRREILRTTFHIHRGLNIPVQVVSECDEFAYETYDLSGLDPQQVEARVETITREMGHRSYDLAQGPLLRVALITSSPNKRALHIGLPALCADAPALGELFKEIVAYYEAAEDPETKGEVMQYADLAEAFNELSNSDESGAGHDYWRGQTVRTATRLPFGRRGANALPFEPQVLSRRVPAGLMTRIIRLAERFDVAPAMALLSCWEVLLWRWTAETEVITGVIHNGRDYEELDSALGLIARCAPMRIQLAGDESFADTLRRVNKAFQEGSMRQEHFRHSDAAEGDRSGLLTYFPTCFEMTELPPDLRAGGVSFSAVEARSYVDRFDVKLSCVRREEVCAVELHYNGGMFRQEVAGSLIEQLLTLVESVIENQDASLDDLNLLSQAEWRRRLIDDNDTRHPFPAGKRLHHLIEEQARRSPDSIALNFENEAVSYAELVERADSLARSLRVLGVGPEKPVAVCAERSPEMVVGLLAVLKAGGFYAPLEPNQPKERLAFILKDVQPAVLLTQARLLELLPERQAQVVLLDLPPSETGANSDDIFTDATDANLAYAIYTSGSTGNPKGVMIPHRAIVNRLLWGQSAYHLTGEDKVLQSAPIGFDFSVWEIFGALIAGAQLVLPQPDGQRDSFYLGRLIAEREVTAAHFVPSMLRLFLEQPGVEMCRSLRYVFSGGEALSVELQDHFFARLEAELYNQYGPTEASVDVTFWRCKRGDDEQTVPIGRPIANTQVYALDRQLRPVPCGAPGELHIGGANIARGYLNRPDLTAELFIPHPFSDASGARLYGTGDLARVRTDGGLEFLGRIDRQVKIRGARVESGEVEAALRAHPAVKEVAISARETPPGDKALVAYLVTHDQTSLRKGELLGHLRTLLPDYMLPGAFVFLKAIPLLTSGKVDYQALPPPSEDGLEQTEFVGARGPVEEILSEIWAGLLGLERVGGGDNFFELGGHSLLATQLASKIRAVFRVEMPLRGLFGSPTVAGMGEEIRRLRRAGAPPQAPPIKRVSVPSVSGVSGPPPLSFAQQRLWFLDQLEPVTPRYNYPTAARLTDNHDMLLLLRYFREIISHHEVLLKTSLRKTG